MQGHILIVGQSGSGKSNVAMSQIMRRINSEQDVHIIDTKNELLPIFSKQCKAVALDGAEEKFNELLATVEIRHRLFAKTSHDLEKPCRDFGEYFKLTGNKLPIVCLVVEELIVMMDTIKPELLTKLLVIGRSAGVFVIALAQYIKADILPRKACINFHTRVFLGRYDRIAIGLLFGEVEKIDSEQLRSYLGPAGKAVVEEGTKLYTRTMPLVEDTDLIPYLKGK